MIKHPWKLVGPWYRGDSVGGNGSNRASAPIIQKYADADFANAVVNEPQRSLRFNGEDFVNRLVLDPNQVITEAERAKSNTPMKLFLDIHSRFYLVICELHCDVPGFPNVDRKQVCEAGFVLRRRVPIVAPSKQLEVSDLLKQRNQFQQELVKANANAQIEQDVQGKQSVKGSTDVLDLIKTKSTQFVSGFGRVSVDTLNQKLKDTHAQLNQFAATGDIKIQLQGWKSTDLKGVGNWQATEEEPEELAEQALPMYPLIADPGNPAHSANGKTLWFGVIPTSSGDADSLNAPKFDDTDLYEVRCFVKRHKPQFPKKTNQQDCCGDLIWSKPTHGYQLATAFDLDGTSHRPVNIKMPDLPALKAQADMGPPGRGAAAKMIAPPDSSLNFATDKMDMPEPGEPLTRAGQQICFFAIFLFFIVALFLFRLFLPILLFIFNLWFLLKLKFCIPPSIEFDAGLVADLSFDGSFGVDFDVSIQADVDLMVDFTADMAVQVAKEGPDIEARFLEPGFTLTVNAGKANEISYNTAQKLKDDMSILVAGGINAAEGMLGEMVYGSVKGDGLRASLELNEMASIFIAMQTEYEDIQHPELAGELPTPEKGLMYFNVIKQSKVAI